MTTMRGSREYVEIGVVIKTLYLVIRHIKAHPGCSRSDIARAIWPQSTTPSADCDRVRKAVIALTVEGLAYQNQETREHYSIVDGWAR
jgi:hypothetical protein